ncbi:MAG: tetraacyldisaccharide 4'-kinase [Planctomycetes bacterium]|nr:tetraacyldisaccharide 4'-kinase [Planctomycetota bacterium]
MKKLYLRIISDQTSSVFGKIIKFCLILLSFLYYFSTEVYKALVKLSIISSRKLPIPVISIGNITVGGTGKTPCVEAIAKMVSSKGGKVAIFSRGYGKHDILGKDDEELQFTDANVRRFTNESKFRIYDTISKTFNPDIVLLDDGFQHWRLKRDFDILLVDATNPFSNGFLLPAGFLREPLSSMKRADLVIITRVNQTSRSQIDKIKRKLLHANQTLHIIEAIHQPEAVKDIKTGKFHDLDILSKYNFLGFCGVGNPIAFRKTLHEIGAKIDKFTAFPDHHYYIKSDHNTLNTLAREFLCNGFITTTKDSMRLEPSFLDGPVFTVIIQFKIVDGEKILANAINKFSGKFSKEPRINVVSQR